MKKLIVLILVCIIFTSCKTEDIDTKKEVLEDGEKIKQEVKEDDKDLKEINNKSFDEEKFFSIDENRKDDFVYEFFETFKLKKEEIKGKSSPLPKSDGGIGFLSDYNLENIPDDTIFGQYIHKDKLYFLSTTRDDEELIKTNLKLISIDKSGNREDIILHKDIKFIQPFFSYNGNILYYSCIGNDDKAYLEKIRLDEKEPNIIKEFGFIENEKGKYNGSFVTMIQIGREGIIYQLSEYENSGIYEKPIRNEIIMIDKNGDIIKSFETDNFDSIYDLGDILIAHRRMYNESNTEIVIFDSLFRKISEIDDIKLNKISGAKKLVKGNIYIIYREIGDKLFITKIEDGSNYDISKLIGDKIKDIRIINDSIILIGDDIKIYK